MELRRILDGGYTLAWVAALGGDIDTRRRFCSGEGSLFLRLAQILSKLCSILAILLGAGISIPFCTSISSQMNLSYGMVVTQNDRVKSILRKFLDVTVISLLRCKKYVIQASSVSDKANNRQHGSSFDYNVKVFCQCFRKCPYIAACLSFPLCLLPLM